MNDLYLELSHSQVGKSLFEALNLPKPPELFRSPETPVSAPHGRILVAGVKQGFALKSVITALSSDTSKLFMFKADSEFAPLFTNHAGAVPNQPLEPVSFDDSSNQRFKSLILDATGLKNCDDLNALYAFFHKAIKHVKRNGHILILAKKNSSATGVYEATLCGAVEGFVKSLAKELGKKGATANLIKLEKGTERQLQTALFYFLSDKCSFVTGQSIELTKGRANPRKINWAKPLEGKIALVTGAAQGIGAETARVLARDGAQVVCLDIPANETALRKFSETIGGHPLALDLAEDSAPEQLIQTLASQMGGIDIVIHNAGITRDKTLGNMPLHFWEQVIDINLNVIMRINELLFERKLLSDRARIVCISSISGIAGNFGQTNYAASKAGVAAYVQKISTLLADGRTINAIAPGFIETEMTKRIPAMTRQVGRRTNSFSQGGEPLDVAEAVSWFCHPASQAINGNLLRVCGQSILGR